MVFVANEAEKQVPAGSGDKPVEDEMLIVPPKGTDASKRMWAYMKAAEMVEAAGSGYNWVSFSNDNCMLFEENLVAYLAPLDATKPHFLGSKLMQSSNAKYPFNSASAIVLSVAGLKVFMEQCGDLGHSRLPYDLQVASCMGKGGVQAGDTRDEQGGERFLMYNPVRSANGKYDDWFSRYKKPLGGAKSGTDCCAEYPIAIHYVEAEEQELLYTMLHESKDGGEVRYEERRSKWQDGYNKIRTFMGGYSHSAEPTDEAAWDVLLRKMRVSGKTRR
jgi:hypothetical protein